MTANHSYFELLCALAESGQLSSLELSELSEHSAGCESCRRLRDEFTAVGVHLLIANASRRGNTQRPRGATDRFINRAMHEGVPLSRLSPSIDWGRLSSVAGILLAALLLVFAAQDGFVSRSANWKSHPADAPARQNEAAASSDISQPTSIATSLHASHRSATRQRPARSHLVALQIAQRARPKSTPALPSGLPGNEVSVVFVPATSFIKFSPGNHFLYGRTPALLTACEDCAVDFPLPGASRIFALPKNRNPQAILEVVLDKPQLAPHFKLDPTAFRLTQNVERTEDSGGQRTP